MMAHAMDLNRLVEHQKRRRKRGIIVLVFGMCLLAYLISMAAVRHIPAPTFLLIYSGGMPVGAGIAIVVASYRVMREIGDS
jgi:hypothetical protein